MSSSNGSSSHKHYTEKAVGLTSEPKSRLLTALEEGS